MKGFIQTLQNIWNIKELRQKLLLTFALLLVYRFGSYVPLPGVDINEVNRFIEDQAHSKTGILGLLNSFTGGSFSRASILALGIMPYISASIVVQLMGLAVPSIQKLQKEGESGRNKVNQITRWLTIGICLVQAPAYLTLTTSQILPYDPSSGYAFYLLPPSNFWFWFPSIIILVTGTIFAMWLGEKITDKGIGNGISILIMVGILADLPRALMNSFETDTSGGMFFLLEILGLILVIAFCIMIVSAVRKVPVQYVRRAQTGSSSYIRSVTDSVRSYIPLKVNAAGVMPIIFAQAIMFLPGTIASYFLDGDSRIQQFFVKMADPFTFEYNLIFGLLIIVFTFFYTAITIPVNQMAEDLKRNGGIIPGIKPGRETANYLDDILSKITLPGAFLLTLVAILPALVRLLGVEQSLAMFFGGTSLLIMVSVILDTVQQINTYLLNQHYDGMMASGRTSRK
ncbi:MULTISPECIES: preprotein translocase subunit SecY [Weeksella]|uniref:Protein translocase subunit SecY n=1 Tax=Weeksella virosa (strain ATCC 43766 / DSM 16922 / JCM 21250 / CCUG 30538 / CDC 9751 / IAM 14551 / NBRC 16016 / NCTC 11634 / CL345/78) TaxID=865938 RepID=F0NYA2_WEEVC|nr:MULTISPECIES: preprotein translocase subunit SecY [Weeksella]ADX68099.1 preprotein translocase, SecY subunit [Weeksella virosa DSM 16922]MDK7374918.1 preprotein translocase subunit SecY [Weeksella virosa]MDK7675439.1 preprotein translocase subunit SecY [Weeksella virosa]OFM83888.1 preprotein translocase subunit SecY [Weeksella sp. HMSC059D05]SUP54410.1 preprotein translocase subunit SecY [Weeksella virosa]